MYTHLTNYDQTRHLASAARNGAFDGRSRRQTHPVRRIRHALAGLARHAALPPVNPAVPAA
jgi:hypothetical protein